MRSSTRWYNAPNPVPEEPRPRAVVASIRLAAIALILGAAFAARSKSFGEPSADRPPESQMPERMDGESQEAADAVHRIDIAWLIDPIVNAIASDDSDALLANISNIIDADIPNDHKLHAIDEALELLSAARQLQWELYTLESEATAWARDNVSPEQQYILWDRILRLRVDRRQHGAILDASNELLALREMIPVPRRQFNEAIGLHAAAALAHGADAAIAIEAIPQALRLAEASLETLGAAAGFKSVEEILIAAEMRLIQLRYGGKSLMAQLNDLQSLWDRVGIDNAMLAASDLKHRVADLRRGIGISLAQAQVQAGRGGDAVDTLEQLAAFWEMDTLESGAPDARKEHWAREGAAVAVETGDIQAAIVWTRFLLASELANVGRSFRIGPAERAIAETLAKLVGLYREAGDFAAAEQHQRQRVAVVTELVGAFPNDQTLAVQWIEAIRSLAEIVLIRVEGNIEEAANVFWQAVASLRTLHDENPRQSANGLMLARVLIEQADFLDDHKADVAATQTREYLWEFLEEFGLLEWLDFAARVSVVDAFVALGRQWQHHDDHRRAHQAFSRARRILDLLRNNAKWDAAHRSRLLNVLTALASISYYRGDFDIAREALEEAVRESEGHPHEDVREAVLPALRILGELHRSYKDFDSARQVLYKARDIINALEGRDGIDWFEAAEVYRMLGELETRTSNVSSALQYFQNEARFRREAAEACNHCFDTSLALAWNLHARMRLHVRTGSWAQAAVLIQEALSLLNDISEHPDADVGRVSARIWIDYADILESENKKDMAATALARAYEIAEQYQLFDPMLDEDRIFLTDLLLRIGTYAEGSGDPTRAVNFLGLVYQLQRPRIPRPIPTADPSLEPRNLARRISVIALEAGLLDAAETYAQEEAEILRSYLFQQPENPLWQIELTGAQMRIARIAEVRGDLQSAHEILKGLVRELQWLADEEPENLKLQHDRVTVYYRLGSLLHQMGDTEAARETWRNGAGIVETMRSRGKSAALLDLQLAETYFALAQTGEDSPRGHRLRNDYWTRIRTILTDLQAAPETPFKEPEYQQRFNALINSLNAYSF